ncbi:Asparagine-rich antigen [Tieghemostelium lacteum]|uniref:Asparagine-rich antigen n=1 Tax=Tieghemostelium lacteum TaxID=361077 RepID=A0A151Z6C6_TIELA|nr:Asparagine-rich antigen [Tieghemostelium lacteum]|eukprot:KYQ89521.1 Asparagine-rich antigen [Tieghemostelium lacteum]
MLLVLAPRLKHKTLFTICIYLTNLDIKEKPLHVDLLKCTNEYSGHNEDLESDSENSDMNISDDESATSGESLSSEEDDEDDEDDEDENVEDDKDNDEYDSYASEETLYSSEDE